MKKYTVTWGWQPPLYENLLGGTYLFYNTEKQTELNYRLDAETGEGKEEVIDTWLCDIQEIENTELLEMLKNSPESPECQRLLLKERILAYGSSRHVDGFYINGKLMWLDKQKRVGLKLRFESEQKIGKQQTTLWDNGVPYPLPLTGDITALDILCSLELYASESYDAIQMHIAMADTLKKVNDMKEYNYKQNLPQMLSFNF